MLGVPHLLNLCRLKGAKNTVVRDYVLPDYTHIKRGYVKVGDNRLKHNFILTYLVNTNFVVQLNLLCVSLFILQCNVMFRKLFCFASSL